jgi:hypothetical protein
VKLKNNRFARRLSSRLLANWHQKAIALVASLFIYVFYRVGTQSELVIPLEPKLPAGYTYARDWPQEVTLIFRGLKGGEQPSEKDFRAVADLSGFTQGGTVKGVVKIELLSEALKRNPPDFDYSPSLVEFVLEPIAEKYVPIDVKANVTGTLPPGYFLESLTYAPQNALVRGPKSLVDKTAKAGIEPFDLTGKKTPFSATVKIVLANGFVRPAAGDEVTVSAVIKGRRTIENVGLFLNGLRADLSVRDAPRGKIEVEGTEKLIDGLDPAALSLTVDCRDIAAPGEYVLPVPRPELPADLASEGAVKDWEPKEVTLRFERKEKDEPR